jgi:hypothetical protein
VNLAKYRAYIARRPLHDAKLLDAFITEHNVVAVLDTHCVHALTGSTGGCGRQFSRCYTHLRSPSFDHPVMFRCADRSRLLVSMPYDHIDRAEQTAYAERHGITLAISDASWYCPGSTVRIVYSAPDPAALKLHEVWCGYCLDAGVEWVTKAESALLRTAKHIQAHRESLA